MSVFKKIDSSDISIIPFNVYKDYTIDSTNYSSSFGVQILQGNHYTHSFGDPLKGIPIIDEPTNPNKTYKGIIHDSINHLYYQRTDKPSENFGGNNPRVIINLYITFSFYNILPFSNSIQNWSEYVNLETSYFIQTWINYDII